MNDGDEVSDDVEFIDGDGDDDDEDMGEDGEESSVDAKVYLPGQELANDEELVCDESAYKMYHQCQTGAPCLSYDVLRDSLGDCRQEFPLTCYVVAGTQAERSHANHVIVMKMSNLHATEQKEDDDDESSDEDEDDKPELEAAMMKHNGGVNRIRATKVGDKYIAASWSETGKVNIWDLSRPLNAVNDSSIMATYVRTEESPPPVFSFSGHQVEGFALDWSPTVAGRLASGDCNKNIHVWNVQESLDCHVNQLPFSAHTASVEDIQWSPNEATVFASCSVDKSIRIWDIRESPAKACKLTTNEAHQRDVNVISWNRNEPFLLSGGDDGMIKVWDLRLFTQGKPVAVFKHHTAPITSVEWHPTDSTVYAASGSDDQITLWDLAVERDSEAAGPSGVEPDVSPQLLFIHQGQKDIKELHWHGQLPGVIISTAHTGFNIFRTISV